MSNKKCLILTAFLLIFGNINSSFGAQGQYNQSGYMDSVDNAGGNTDYNNNYNDKRDNIVTPHLYDSIQQNGFDAKTASDIEHQHLMENKLLQALMSLATDLRHKIKTMEDYQNRMKNDMSGGTYSMSRMGQDGMLGGGMSGDMSGGIDPGMSGNLGGVGGSERYRMDRMNNVMNNSVGNDNFDRRYERNYERNAEMSVQNNRDMYENKSKGADGFGDNRYSGSENRFNEHGFDAADNRLPNDGFNPDHSFISRGLDFNKYGIEHESERKRDNRERQEYDNGSDVNYSQVPPTGMSY